MYDDRGGRVTRYEVKNLIDVIEANAGSAVKDGQLTSLEMIYGLDAWLNKDITSDMRQKVGELKQAFLSSYATTRTPEQLDAASTDVKSQNAGQFEQYNGIKDALDKGVQPGQRTSVARQADDLAEGFERTAEQQRALLAEAQTLPDSDAKTALVAKLQARVDWNMDVARELKIESAMLRADQAMADIKVAAESGNQFGINVPYQALQQAAADLERNIAATSSQKKLDLTEYFDFARSELAKIKGVLTKLEPQMKIINQ